MKKKIIICVSWLLVLVWMIVIFYFSNMYGISSVNKSRKIIKDTIESTIDTTNNAGITDIKPTQESLTKTVKKIDYPFRKIMHVSEYTILCILFVNALYQSGVKSKKIYLYGIVFCFVYACTDEIHQLYRARTGEFKDVIIDTLGSLIGVFICVLSNRIFFKNNVK